MCLPAGNRCSGHTSPPHGRCALHSLCEGGKGEGEGGGNYEEKRGKEHAKYIPVLSCTSHLWFLLLGACLPR